MQPTTPTTDTEPLPDRTSVHIDAYRVERYRILGTRTFRYVAWAPVESIGLGSVCPFSTITHEEDRWWGRLGTQRLPHYLDEIAPGPERIDQVLGWQDAQYDHAYWIILRAFPEADGGYRSMGDITRTLP